MPALPRYLPFGAALKRLDHHLLLNRRLVWVSQVHHVVYFSALAAVVLWPLVALMPAYQIAWQITCVSLAVVGAMVWATFLGLHDLRNHYANRTPYMNQQLFFLYQTSLFALSCVGALPWMVELDGQDLLSLMLWLVVGSGFFANLLLLFFALEPRGFFIGAVLNLFFLPFVAFLLLISFNILFSFGFVLVSLLIFISLKSASEIDQKISGFPASGTIGGIFFIYCIGPVMLPLLVGNLLLLKSNDLSASNDILLFITQISFLLGIVLYVFLLLPFLQNITTRLKSCPKI